MRRQRIAVLVGLLLVAPVACGNKGRSAHDASGKPAFSRSQSDSVVTVTANGFAFAGIPPVVSGPKVFFELRNDDTLRRHDLEVEAIPGAKFVGGVEALDPHRSASASLVLPPGGYMARCHVKLGDTYHSDLGQEMFFRVT